MITAGEVLKSKREALGKSLETVSEDTKIQIRFLKYIEDNDFSKFDSDVFLTGFIKIYAQYLDLDSTKVLALFRRSKPTVKKSDLKTKSKSLFKVKKSFLTPKFFITISIALFLLLVIGYIGIQIYNFQSPPKLQITEPQDNLTTTSQYLTVRGNTDENSSLDINDSPVKINNDGTFEKELTLNEGVNLITVTVRKNSNTILESTEILKVTYTKEQEQTEEEEKPQTNTLRLEVSNSVAWIKLDIDGQNKISQNVQPSKQEFTVVKSFRVTTGRLANTKIFFNDAPVSWNTNTTTGVAEISCEITNQLLNCK